MSAERADVQKIREAAEFVGGEGYAAVASALHKSADSLAAALREKDEALREITQTDWDASEGITPFQFEQRIHAIAAAALRASTGRTSVP